MSPNMKLNEREITPRTPTVANGASASAAIDKSKGAICGLIVIPSVTANLTFTVSVDDVTYSPITPPAPADFTGVTNNSNLGKAFPAEWLAFLAPYPYFKVNFSAAQTTGATVLVPVMA